MGDKFAGLMITVAIGAITIGAVGAVSVSPFAAQAPTVSAGAPAGALKTPWGEPDLQGIWTDESDTPLQRSPKFANQEFFTEAQRAELDKLRSAFQGRERRSVRGTEADVAGAYNAVFTPMKRTGTRTSRIVDPPNGRLPATDGGSAETCRRRAGLSGRLAAIDRNLQKQGGGVQWRQIRSGAIAAV